jgi:hypothetical protein
VVDKLKNFCVEYITNDGGYHMFSILTTDLDTAIANTLADHRRNGGKAIPKANIHKSHASDNRFTLFDGFRINDFNP